MLSSDDIRQTVVEHIIIFISRMPAYRRPEPIPAYRTIRNDTALSALGLKYRDKFHIGIFLHKRGKCSHLPASVTGHWKTVEDVVTSVIRYPPDQQP